MVPFQKSSRAKRSSEIKQVKEKGSGPMEAVPRSFNNVASKEQEDHGTRLQSTNLMDRKVDWISKQRWFHHRPEFLESRREVPVTRAALRGSRVGLTTFGSGLYHAMSRAG